MVDQAHVRPTLPDFRVEATSDASGAFTLRGLPPGRVVLFLDSEDERLGRIRGGDPVVETGSDEVVLEIVPTARLHVVVRAPPGEKVDRVSLRVYGWKDAGAWRVQGATLIPGDVPEAIWDSQGLDPEGRYLVVAEGEWGDVSGGRGVLERVVPRDEPYVLVLEPAPLIRGRVVTADDVPVADASVRLYDAQGGPWRRMLATQGRASAIAHTDAQGRFVIRAPAAGRWLVSAIAPGLTPLPRPPLIDGAADDVCVVLRPTLSVAGRISDPTGGPPPRLHVTAVSASGDVGLWRHSVTMGGGFFDVPDLAAGAWRVVAWPEDSDFEDDDLATSSPAPSRRDRAIFAWRCVAEACSRDGSSRSEDCRFAGRTCESRGPG